MASKTNATPSRYAQLTALLEFAKETGYTGHTDKLAAVASQWAPKGANSETRKENLKIARALAEQMTAGEWYSNKNVREQFNGIPVGTTGKVNASKVSAIMNLGVIEGIFKTDTKFDTKVYALAD